MPDVQRGEVSDERFLVIGGGTMGRGIAQVAAVAGYHTVVAELNTQIAERTHAAVTASVAREVERGRMTSAESADALSRLSMTTSLAAAAAAADIVIEAVVEDMRLKQEIFATLAAQAPPAALLATNTSALSVTEIAAGAGLGERLVGMHFFNPVPRMRLLEIVRGLETKDEVIARAQAVAERLGKESVVVNEAPGFAVSRINAMIGNEAFYMLMEGVASATDIDKALKLGLNHPMGPFELGDLVGWDVRLSVLEELHRTLGEKFRPCPLLVRYVKAGRLGRKVGRGVFDYPAT